MRVLIIDDETDFLTVAKAYLEGHGHDVHTMSAGFGVVNRVANPETEPDIVVLDAMMPALSGEAILHLLAKHERAAAVPVLMYTNSTPSEERLRSIHPNVRVRSKGRLSVLRAAIEAREELFTVVRTAITA